jgi:hypothetical protein
MKPTARLRALLGDDDNFDPGRGPFAPRVWGRAGTIWAFPTHNLCTASLAILQWAATPDAEVLAVPGSIARSNRIKRWLAANPPVTSWRRS